MCQIKCILTWVSTFHSTDCSHMWINITVLRVSSICLSHPNRGANNDRIFVGFVVFPQRFETVTCCYCARSEHCNMIWSFMNHLVVCCKQKFNKSSTDIFVEVYIYAWLHSLISSDKTHGLAICVFRFNKPPTDTSWWTNWTWVSSASLPQRKPYTSWSALVRVSPAGPGSWYFPSVQYI